MNIALIGLGLMGGSLAAALKKVGHSGRVLAYARRAETRDAASAQGIADEVFDDPAACVEGADVVVLCLPVLAMEACIAACRDALKLGAIVTDVGSTKSELHDALSAALADSDASYLGSHPMAGYDENGLDALDPDLYTGALVILTPDDGTDPEHVARLQSLWESVGSKVVAVSPAEHDRLVAATSHFPHLLASLLVKHVLGEASDRASFCGSGFRDATRIAGGESELWHDIFRSNRENLLHEIDAFARELEAMRDMLTRADYDGVRRFLDESRTLRREMS